MVYKDPCDECKLRYKFNKKPPPCEACKPEILEANEDAVFVYTQTQRQVITAGLGEAIAVKYEAIEFIWNLYEIENRRDCFEKVTWIFNYILQENKVKKGG